jgi:hypothetical protein
MAVAAEHLETHVQIAATVEVEALAEEVVE